MITFDFRLMWRLVQKSLFRTRGTDARLTRKRVAVLLFVFPFYLINELFVWIGLLLDEIFFRGYQNVEVTDPLFLVGAPRSGTTFLHRLLAKDGQCTSMRLWEIIFAPSITQKKFFLALGAIDRRLGEPFSRRLRQFERQHMSNPMHQGGLFEPEEDEVILLHIFSSGIFLRFIFPFDDELLPLARFDLELHAAGRRRIMIFYKKCIQRHLYVFGKQKRFFSKSPTFSTKIQSIREIFPNARFINLVRNPLETFPSTVSLLSFFANVFYTPMEPYPMRNFGLRIVQDCYSYPLKQLETWPAHTQATVIYNDLVADPGRTVLRLYERFHFNLSPAYQSILQEEKKKASRYRSSHVYSLDQTGLTRGQIVSTFREIFDRFGFDTNKG